MTARTARPCRKPRCPHLSRDGTGWCKDHKQSGNWEHANRPTASQRGYGAEWRKIRQRIMRRDSGICQLCKAEGVISAATDIDHITPKSQGGSDQAHNLRALCKACHKAQTAKQSALARTDHH